MKVFAAVCYCIACIMLYMKIRKKNESFFFGLVIALIFLFGTILLIISSI